MRSLWVLTFVMLLAGRCWALECDQFTVPPRPLVDLGTTLDAKIVHELKIAVDDANAERADNLRKAAATRSPNWKKIYTRRAESAVTQQALAERVYRQLAGGGVPRCRIENWVLDHRSGREALLQPMPVSDSIYGANPFQRPFLLVELSPTMRLHDQYIGVDKLGHFFQQGYEYFTRYVDVYLETGDESPAMAAAVQRGVKQERGFYGEAIIGIYSNADLAANYAGLLFYRNLFEPVTVHGQTLSPLIIWDGDRLKLSPQRTAGDVLKPFVTDHWSEAMNPSHYARLWRPFVRTRIADRTDAWLAFHQMTLQTVAERMEALRTFDGIDYGHGGWDGVVTLVNTASPNRPRTTDTITAVAHD